jgi:hypothetical protein
MSFNKVAAVVLFFLSASAAPAHAQGGFQARMLNPTRDVAGLAPIRRYLDQTQLLQNISAAMNGFVTLPRPVTVTGAECGQVNAFYHPQTHEIVMCYEIVRDIIGRFRAQRLDATTLEAAVVGATAFILYHEVGHALIAELDLPATGREEDAVDQFAAYVMGSRFPLHAMWAAQYWMERAGPSVGGYRVVNQSAFADEHGIDEQRFYNVMCWTYGVSPSNRTSMLRYIPQARAARCPHEATQTVRAWDRLLARHRRSAPATQRPVQPSAPWVNGVWSYNETIGRPGAALHCVNQGAYNFNAAGNAVGVGYRQTGQCAVEGQVTDASGDGTGSGTLVGAEVRFTLDNCNYAGIGDATGRRISGTIACAVVSGGRSVEVRGTWQAWR